MQCQPCREPQKSLRRLEQPSETNPSLSTAKATEPHPQVPHPVVFEPFQGCVGSFALQLLSRTCLSHIQLQWDLNLGFRSWTSTCGLLPALGILFFSMILNFPDGLIYGLAVSGVCSEGTEKRNLVSAASSPTKGSRAVSWRPCALH